MQSEVIQSIKRGGYSFKKVFQYAPGWTCLYVLIMSISALVSPARIYVLERLVDSVSTTFIYRSIFLWGGLLVATILLGNLFSLVNGFVTTMISSGLQRGQIPVALRKFRQIEYSCFENPENQDTLQRIAGSPQSEVLSVFSQLLAIISSAISTVGVVLLFFRASVFLGIASIVTMIPMFLMEGKAANKEMKLRWNMTADIRKRYYLQQLFVDKDALQEIKLFDAKDLFVDMSEEYTKKINKDMKSTLESVIRLSTGSSAMVFLFTGTSMFLLLFALSRGNISFGTFVSLITALSSFYGSIRGTVGTVANYLRLSVNIKYYQDFLALPERTHMASTEKEASANAGKRMNAAEIRFEHVSFHYPTSEKEVLHNVSFTITPGQRVAFVGKNGAGKTTIIKLLLGLYKPTKGIIRIGGIDSTELSDEERQKVFSVVFQDYQNYELTLRENIAFGNIGKLYDDDAILHAMKDAGVDDLLERNDRRFEMHFGRIFKDGENLSGGQWQRIALARAYLSDTDFIIMDEPTAALDPLAESEMYTQFSSILKDRGAIMISHRLASAKMAEKIFVLEGGRIAEDGTHEQLISNGGIYAEMWKKQSSWYTERKVAE